MGIISFSPPPGAFLAISRRESHSSPSCLILNYSGGNYGLAVIGTATVIRSRDAFCRPRFLNTQVMTAFSGCGRSCDHSMGGGYASPCKPDPGTHEGEPWFHTTLQIRMLTMSLFLSLDKRLRTQGPFPVISRLRYQLT